MTIATVAAKVWTKEEIRQRLLSDNWWLARGIEAIYERQTRDEQVTQTTREHNKVGFGAMDAEILSSFAVQIAKWRRELNKQYAFPLSPKQIEKARKYMPKYAGQLADIANKPR